MDQSLTKLYLDFVDNLTYYNVSADKIALNFNTITNALLQADRQNMYKESMKWIEIGMTYYIAAASLLCILAMAADLLHGLRNRKLWFPCKYFTINSAFLSVISVAMKIPMDNSMPGDVDQLTKLGSMAFMCTMMANLLPSLATMDSMQLLSNIIALGVMVVVNVCIQIRTGFVSKKVKDLAHLAAQAQIDPNSEGIDDKGRNNKIATIYATLLLMLLLVYTCSSLAILKSKKMIQVKHQERHDHDTASKELPKVEELLRKDVRKYWIMSGIGSPQFITICSVTTSACGVICVLSTTLHILTLVWTIKSVKEVNYKSDYKRSVLVIFITQFIGVILGTIAPLCRCFAPLCFEVSIESIRNRIKVFEVESYWTQKLHDWRKSSIPFTFGSDKCQVIIEILKILFLNFCIEFQEAVVVTCKIISLVPFFFVICVFYCLECLNARNVELGLGSGKKYEELAKNKDELGQYVLQLGQDEMKISGRTLKWLSISLERLIQKGGKRNQGGLIELIAKSSDFKGVEMFDSDRVTSLLEKEYQTCWSLPVVTLTTIAISLPGIDKSKADKLLRSVKAGLVYVTHVEQSLNTSDDYLSIQKAARILWLECRVYRKWFGNKLQELASRVDTAKNIVQLFNNIAKHMVNEVESTGSRDDNSKCKSICANSMYRITNTILHSDNIDNNFRQEDLFEHISQIISGILAACLTNLPKVIEMKCHTCAIEKMEANVQVAAQLLGETTLIIDTLKDRDLPGLNPDDLPFIDKWCAYLRQAFP